MFIHLRLKWVLARPPERESSLHLGFPEQAYGTLLRGGCYLSLEAHSQNILVELIVTETPLSCSRIQNQFLTSDLHIKITLCAIGKESMRLV